MFTIKRCAFLLSAALALGISSAFGYDWSQYAAGSSPNLGAGMYEITEGDFQYVNTFSMIYLNSGSSVVSINITGDKELSCPIRGPGVIEKRGTGAVTLQPTGANDTYQCEMLKGPTLKVVEGTFLCPQDKGRYLWLGAVDVAAGAVFATAKFDTTLVAGLSGAGIVTNMSESSGVCVLRLNGQKDPASSFTGRILGKGIRMMVEGRQELLNAANDFPGEFALFGNNDGGATGGGYLGVGTFGKLYQPSSVGSWSTIKMINTGAYVKYLGTGEDDVTRKLSYAGDGADTSAYYVDAGEHGGVTFKGDWTHGQTRSERLVLTGSNTTAACVLDNALAGDTATSPTYIIKRGPGVWKMADNAGRANTGGIAVEEGVLQFASIAEAGEVCSLGLATCLQSAYSGTYDVSKNVDYAFLLGTPATRGMLEYVGSAAAKVTTRPVAVNGEGGICNSSTTDAKLDFSGATALAGSKSKLVLSGDAPLSCFGEVADGDGTLGIVKEGSGTWRLGGHQDISGEVTVKTGTLEVEGPRTKDFTWFKFLVRGNGDPTTSVRFLGFEFYDENGVSQLTSENMSFLGYTPRSNNWYADPNDWSNIQPGQYGWARPGPYLPQIGATDDNDIGSVFNVSGNMGTDHVRVQFLGDAAQLDPKLESTWWPILIRVPSGVNPIRSFDIMRSYSDGGLCLRDWSLMASEDGDSWEEVARYDYNQDTFPGAFQWYSDKSSYGARPGKGFEFKVVTPDYNPFADVTGVNVAAGATLKAVGKVTLPALTLDCANGNGTLDGFDFAETGVINLVNAKGPGAVGPHAITLKNLPEGALARLNDTGKWTFLRDGKADPNWTAKVTENGFTVSGPGMVILLR